MDTNTEVLRSVPPIAVTAASYNGLCLQEWLYVATITYTVIQIFLLLRDKVYYRYFKKERRKPSGED